MVVYYFVVKIKNLNDFTFIQDFRKKTLISRGATTGLLGNQGNRKFKNHPPGHIMTGEKIQNLINSSIFNKLSSKFSV